MADALKATVCSGSMRDEAAPARMSHRWTEEGVTVDAPFTVASRDGTGATVRVTPFAAPHGATSVLGFRIGRFGYLTDVNAVPPEALAALEGVDTLVLDGLRPDPHPTHLSFSEASAVAAQIGARETWLVHVTHSALHAEADASLPDGVRLASDGLVLEVPGA